MSARLQTMQIITRWMSETNVCLLVIAMYAFINGRKWKFADPDKESLTEEDAEVTSDVSKDQRPCHVRSHLDSRFIVAIASNN